MTQICLFITSCHNPHPTNAHSLVTLALGFNMSKSLDTKLEANMPSIAAAPEPALVVNGKPGILTNGDKGKPPEDTDGLKAVKPAGKPAIAGGGEKLSGAELKKRAKAEKQARRAQEKQTKPEAVLPDLKSPRKVETPADVGARSSTGGAPGTPTAKGQHKTAGSSSKPMALRPAAQAAAVAPAPQPKKESKNVALFGHLYGQPRRTTIAAAGKDVHPAVLALGLQMSNYVVCGSNARCVATLLVFKRVCASHNSQSGLCLHYTQGNPIICHSSTELFTTPSHLTSLIPDRIPRVMSTTISFDGELNKVAEARNNNN